MAKRSYKLKYTVLLTYILLISGCVNMAAKKPTVSYSSSIVDTLSQYYEASQAGLISPYKLFDPSGKNPGVVDGNEYRMFRRWWCLDSSSTKGELESLISGHCSANGGVFKNGWCSDKKSESPIYKVSVGKAGMVGKKSSTAFCSTGEDIGVLAYEKNSNISNQSWLDISTAQLGFESPSEFTQRLKKEREEKWRTSQEKLKKKTEQANLVLASKRGTRICKDFDRGDHVYVGYIEDKTDEKIKINVAQAVYKRNARFSVNGFQPTLIWDYPNNWYVCE